MKLSLPQQSVNILRSFLVISGWAASPAHVFSAGKLVVEILPEPDLSWLKSKEEVGNMSLEERKAYFEKDKAFCDLPVEFDLSEQHREAIRACLSKFVPNLPIGIYTCRLLETFGLSS